MRDNLQSSLTVFVKGVNVIKDKEKTKGMLHIEGDEGAMAAGYSVGIWIRSWDRKRENCRTKYRYFNNVYNLGNSTAPMLISQF